MHDGIMFENFPPLFFTLAQGFFGSSPLCDLVFELGGAGNDAPFEFLVRLSQRRLRPFPA